MTYYGIDTSSYPGDAAVAYLKVNTSINWMGLYLAHAAGSPDVSWKGVWQGLRGGTTAWGVAPLYAGFRDPDPTRNPPNPDSRSAANGALDGAEALQIAHDFGIPSGSVIFLDIEQGGVLPQNALDYIAAWSKAVAAGANFAEGLYSAVAGIYCSHTSVAQILAATPGLTTWVWNLT